MSDTPESPAPLPPVRRRPPWRRSVVVVAFLVVAGAAVWWRQTATSDPKLQFTMFNRVNWADQDATGNQDGITQTRNVNGTQVDISFVSNRRFFVYIGVRNEGGRAVKIEDVPATGFYYFGFDTMEVSPEREIGIGQMTTYEPFKPFTLEPGEGRNVRLNFRMAECSPTDLRPGTTFIKGLVMRYKILGLKRAWLVPFDESALTVPTIGRCERPISDPAPTGS